MRSLYNQIQDTVMKRPLIILTALLAFPALAADNPADSTKAAQETPAKPFVYAPKPTDIVIGKDDAPVTIVEYASLSCPHCAHFFNEALPQLTDKYIEKGKVRLVYRHYPLNDPALKAAELVNCADKDRRHTFLTVLYKQQSRWAYGINVTDSLANIAAMGGIERKRFDKCLQDKAMEKTILAVEKEAADVYKVNSTPTFYVNNVQLTGDSSIVEVSKAVDAALAAKTKK